MVRRRARSTTRTCKGKIAKRYFFLIDRDGIVRGKWLGEDLAVFPTEVLLKAARDLSARR